MRPATSGILALSLIAALVVPLLAPASPAADGDDADAAAAHASGIAPGTLALQPAVPGTGAADAPVPADAADPIATPAQPRIPFRFEPNLGQWPDDVRFAARGGAPATLVDDGLRLPGGVAVSWGAAESVAAESATGTVSHYLLGNDRSKWVEAVPHAQRVRYAGVAPGVDVVVYGNDGRIEFDHVVAPGADPAAILLRVAGALPRLADDGSLVLGDWTLDAPRAYQDGPAGRVPVAAAFDVEGDRVRYGLGAYDTTRPLVIDPVVRYSSFVGVFNTDQANAVALQEPVGAPGTRRLYVAGDSLDIDNGAGIVYPLPFVAGTNATRVAPYASFVGTEAWVGRFDYDIPSRTMTAVWFAYVGGTSTDVAAAVAVNAAGDVAVAGHTTSTNFPTLNPIQVATPAYDGSVAQGSDDVFVATFSASGTFRFATYLGSDGIDSGDALALLDDGTVVVGGEVRQVLAGTGFPTTVGAYQPAPGSTGGNIGDGYVSRIDPATTPASFVFSTFLGGAGTESVEGLDVDASGIYVVGFTNQLGNAGVGNTFPTTVGAYQTSYTAMGDAFITKFDLMGSTLLYSTLLGGGASDHARRIEVDESGRAWVTLFTQSTDLPICGASPNPCVTGSPVAFQASPGGFVDAFLLRLDATGSTLSFGSYLGGSGDDRVQDMDYNRTAQRLAVVGYTTSSNFPTTAGALYPTQLSTGSWTDGYLLRLNTSSGSLHDVTFYGAGGNDRDEARGVALDDEWGIYFAGRSEDGSLTFPETANRLQPTFAGREDGYLAIIGKLGPATVLRAQSPGEPTVTVDPFSGIFTVDGGSAVQLDVLTSVAGDFALNLTGAVWEFFDGHGPLTPLPSPAPASSVSWTRPSAQLGTACVTVWDTDPVGTFDRFDRKCIRIEWRNLPPDAANDSLPVQEDGGAQTLNVLANDNDPEGQPLTIVGATPLALRADQGSFSWSSTGITFTPAPHYYNVPPPGGVPDLIRIEYTVEDAHGARDTATLNVSVVEVNDPPVAVDDAVSIPEDVPVEVVVLTNDHRGPDPPETLVVAAVGAPSGGTATDLGGGRIRFTPPLDQTGTFTFPYTLSDGRGGTDTAVVTVNVLGDNDAPAAADDTYTVAEDTPSDLSVLLNDADADGDPLVVVSATAPAQGSVQVFSGFVRYLPAADFAGTDAFSYTVSDGLGGTATATVSVVVQEVNDPPVAVADAVTVEEDSLGNEVFVLANDHAGPDAGETLVVASVGAAAHGATSLVGGRVFYTPAADYMGADAFTYTVADGRGGTATAAVAVTVRPENLAPLPQDDAATAIPGVPGQCFDVLANDVDPDGPQEALRLVLLLPGPDAVPAGTSVAADGRALCSDGTVLGLARFRQTVSDGDRTGEAGMDLLVALPADPLVVLEQRSGACIGQPTTLRAYAGWAGHHVVSWRWVFPGAERVVAATQPYDVQTHAFDAVGAATVTVEAIFAPDAGGATTDVAANLPVDVAGCRPPVVDFTAVTDRLTAAFRQEASDPDGGPLLYEWSFGDGATSFAADPSHTYAAPGVYRVRLTVFDIEDDVAYAERTVIVGLGGDGGGSGPPPPTGGDTPAESAGEEAPPAPVNRRPTALARTAGAVAGGPGSLDGSSSSDPDGDALAFAWQQTAGAPVVLLRADTARPSFLAPDTTGALRFRLTVSDGRLAHSTEVEVEVAAPEALGDPTAGAARFVVRPGATTLALRFDAARGAPGASYEWSFGDGATASGPEAEHTFAAPGTHLVRLRVTEGDQVRESVQAVQVTADDPPALQETRATPAQTAGLGPLVGGALVGVAILVVLLAAILLGLARRR